MGTHTILCDKDRVRWHCCKLAASRFVLAGAAAFARPRGLTLWKHNNGSAPELTGSLDLRLRSTLNLPRNDAAPDDVGVKKLSSPARFAGIFPHHRAIDRLMQGR
jgi:hypothetical protein